ncbi:MAG: AAA family ATPase [Paracoccaceae bacterium]|nr:AAA family ATPase [Paracoccaceae bacterium]
MSKNEKSILVVATDKKLAEQVGRALKLVPGAKVSSESKSFAKMNGKAGDATFQHDIVFFETHGDDAKEMDALEALLNEKGRGHTRFVALAHEDMPLSQTRRLTRIGVDDVMPLSAEDAEFSEAVRAAVRPAAVVPQVGPAESPSRQGRMIAVAGACGGIGATTVAVNLAYQLLDRKGLMKKSAANRVVLVDMDFQFGNAGIFLDVEDNGGMMELTGATEVPDRTFIEGMVTHHESGLDVISAPLQFAPLDALRPDVVRGFLTELKKNYDFVVVDMPRALVAWVDSILVEAEQLLMVTDTTVPSIRQARRMIRSFTEEHINLPIEIVVNHEAKPVFQAPHQKEAAKVLERPLNFWLPDNPKVARSAVDRGEPIVATAQSSDLGKAMRKMATKISKAEPALRSASA